MFTWGRSDYGQLGYKSRYSDSASSLRSFTHVPQKIPELAGIKQVACGSEHTIALSGDDQVLTFGWNEHGMCGTGDEKNIFVPHRATILNNELSVPILVGSGAGHCMAVLRNC